ncbi:MAG: filamentous hemagglutinin N-terminal domain-containing protein [Parvibaculum sp.]
MKMRSICAAGMMAALAWSGVAQAAPTGSTVQAGTAAISSVSNGPGTTVTVNQSTDRLYVDWSSFNIDAADVIDFVQNTSQSIAVNRVTGGSLSPTTIDGILNANGHVWILDPSGIAFGATATINVGGLLVTTANIEPTAFMSVATLDDAGGFIFTSGGNGNAVVSNAGTINSSGLLALVAPFVDNSGSLTSSYGDVLLGGAEAFRVSFSEVGRADPTPFDELLVTDFIIDTPVTNDPTPGAETVPVTNTGSLTGANVIATAASVGGGAFINMDGVVEATNVGTQSGDIVLLGGGNFTSGAADASSGATEVIRVKNADLTAAGKLVAQGSNVSIEKGTGPGTVTAGAARIEATSGDVTSDAAIETTTGGIDIKAFNLASLSGIDAKTTVDVTAKDIDLDGLVNGDTSVTLEATDATKDISGTDIDITGGSVTLTGKVAATDSATIQALTSDATLNDDITSTGSILIEALLGKASIKGVDADTTTTITARDIDLDGTVNGDTSVALEATDATRDISGADIDITGGRVDLTGKVVATDSATIQALTSDATLNDDITSTGSILIEALPGKASVKGADADTTTTITAKDIDLDGLVNGDTSVTLEATDATKDISGAHIDITGGTVDLTGKVAAVDSATIQALTGDATLTNDITSTGSVLIEALLGRVSVKGVDADTTTTITARDIDLDGTVNGDTLVALEATDATKDISGTDIDITGGDIDLTGAVVATDTVTLSGDDINLAGKVTGGGAVEMTASGAGNDISGANLDINGGSVTLTGPVATTTSATIKATTTDVTLNDDITSTGSILIEALLGKASVKGVDADTTTTITARDIDLDGTVNGDTSVALEATDATRDISGADIDITGGSVALTGKVAAVDSATIQALTSDVTLNDDLTSTGSVLIEALLGKVIAAGLSAVTTLEVYAKEILISGDAVAGDNVTIRASNGDATLSGNTESTNGNVLVEAKLGTASVFDVASHLATTITGGTVKVLGDLVATGPATLQALTGNVDVQGSVTANGGLLLLNAAQGDAVINRIASTTNVSIQALDLDLSGSISAGDEVVLTSLDSGTTIVLGGDGGVGSFTLRMPQGLTIDAGELGRISAGNLRIDAAGNDALLRSVDFSDATLGDISIGANSSSWIMTDGIVKGLNTLTLGYVDGLDDRRPGLVLVGGSLGKDTASGADWLGEVVINSSQDIIIGSQAFRTYYETKNPTLSQLGSPVLGAMGVASNHVFIATNSLELYAPGDIVQLNTGSGVDGKGLVFRVSAVGKAVLNPVDGGPEKVVLFGTVVRDDNTRVTSFSAGLEPRLLYEGEKDEGGNVIVEPLAQSTDYHFNLCIIGDPVSCSNALLRQAEGTSAAADSDPNPAALQTGLTFDTDDKDDDDDDDTSGVAATGNESLWGASAQ